MKKLLLTFLLAAGSCAAFGQAPGRPTYMQIYFAGSGGWVSDQPVLQFVPAFRGKTEGFVQDTKLTKPISPDAFREGMISQLGKTFTGTATVVSATDESRPPTAAEARQMQDKARREFAQEKAQTNRLLRLQAARARLARLALLTALNQAAADGWEVVQMTSTGQADGMVYLLKRR